MEDDGLSEAERLQIQQIRELEFEELEIEEVEERHGSDDDSASFNFLGRGDAGSSGELAFDTSLASLHTYLGEVEGTHNRSRCLDTGARLTLPLLYLEGVVLFPEATLPLRVIQPPYISAVKMALDQVNARNTVGVARVFRDVDGKITFANVGTTAEIMQYRELEDGSLNLVTRGRQRFSVLRRWLDVDRTPLSEVQIIQEDIALRAPRDAFGKLPSQGNSQLHTFSHTASTNDSHGTEDGCRQEDNDSDAMSEESFENELSPSEIKLHRYAISSYYGDGTTDESTNSDDDRFVCQSENQFASSCSDESSGSTDLGYEKTVLKNMPKLALKSQFRKGDSQIMAPKLRQRYGVQKAFWPYWVYEMYDSYTLAKRAADMWKKIVGSPSMDDVVKKPDVLSFSIASKIPVSESARQELLEINGISYRLRREIELLKNFDLVHCKGCQAVIAKRSDMLVMSSEGPLGAYVNPHGYVHEIMTFHRATGLTLLGRPSKEYSWFPGYSWTIANCFCENQMGWLFTALDKRLKPRLFWGIRSSQVADMC